MKVTSKALKVYFEEYKKLYTNGLKASFDSYIFDSDSIHRLDWKQRCYVNEYVSHFGTDTIGKLQGFDAEKLINLDKQYIVSMEFDEPTLRVTPMMYDTANDQFYFITRAWKKFPEPKWDTSYVTFSVSKNVFDISKFGKITYLDDYSELTFGFQHSLLCDSPLVKSIE